MILGQAFAIFGDVIRQSLDRRGLQVLLLLGLVLAILCLGVSVRTTPIEEALRKQATHLNEVRVHAFGDFHAEFVPSEHSVGEIRRAGADDGLPSVASDAWTVELRFPKPEQLEDLVRKWRSAREFEATGRWPAPDPADATLTVTDHVEFLEDRFTHFGYSRAKARQEGADPGRFLVTVATDYPHEIAGVGELRLFFGSVSIPMNDQSVATTVIQIQLGLVKTFVGFLGMLILLSICAGFVPELLRKGTVDLALARPITRTRLLLLIYAASVTFILLFSFVLLLGCAAGLGIGTGYFNPWFLMCALTMATAFAVLFSVSVLVGVLTRSGNLAALAAIVVWVAGGLVTNLHHQSSLIFGEYPRVRAAIKVAYWLLPKTSDISSLNTVFLSRSHLSPAAYQRLSALHVPEVDWWMAGGTTAAFVALMLALAAWLFHRRDW